MSSAEIERQLKIKINTVKRLHKELTYYQMEQDKEQQRVDKMRSESADPHDLKQAVSARAWDGANPSDSSPECCAMMPLKYDEPCASW